MVREADNDNDGLINCQGDNHLGTGDVSKTDEWPPPSPLFGTFPKIHPFWRRHLSLLGEREPLHCRALFWKTQNSEFLIKLGEPFPKENKFYLKKKG